MKKLFILSILIFLGIFGSHAETNIVKSNKVKTGIYKYSNDINIEYVILEDIDEAIIYSYREQEEVDDRLNTKDTSATLENALTEFTKLNLNKFSKYKKALRTRSAFYCLLIVCNTLTYLTFND